MSDENKQTRSNFQIACDNFDKANLKLFLAKTKDEIAEARKELKVALEDFNKASQELHSHIW